jgi:hypothetical protein
MMRKLYLKTDEKTHPHIKNQPDPILLTLMVMSNRHLFPLKNLKDVPLQIHIMLHTLHKATLPPPHDLHRTFTPLNTIVMCPRAHWSRDLDTGEISMNGLVWMKNAS